MDGEYIEMIRERRKSVGSHIMNGRGPEREPRPMELLACCLDFDDEVRRGTLFFCFFIVYFLDWLDCKPFESRVSK